MSQRFRSVSRGQVFPSGYRGRISGTKKPAQWPVFLYSRCIERHLEIYVWCPEGDSNSHFFRKRILNPPRLPIPPSGLNGGEV